MNLIENEQVLGHQQFMLFFADQMGPLAEVEQVFWMAATLLGEYLNASRCFLAEIDEEDQLLVAHRNYSEDLDSLEGVFPLSALTQEQVEELEHGHPVIVPASQPAFLAALPVITGLTGLDQPEQPASFGLPATITLLVPILRNARLIMIGVLQNLKEDRKWTDSEVLLIQNCLERTCLSSRNARLYQQAQRLAVIDERTRVARELHDSLSQDLFAIQLGINTALAHLSRDTHKDEVVNQLKESLLQIDGTNNELRSLIFDLRPEALQTTGLVQALNNFITSLRTRHKLEVKSFLNQEPQVSLAVKEALYWIARQALQNIVTHARATKVEVYLRQQNQQIIMEITDNGRGFEVTQSYPGHWGVRFMRNRAVELGGQCEITSSPGQGTSIQVYLPSSEPLSQNSFNQTPAIDRDRFTIKLAKLNRRVEELEKAYDQTNSITPTETASPDNLLTLAFYELNNALEELQVTEEGLHQHNLELETIYQESENKHHYYQELFELAPVGYLITDPLGIVREANEKVCKVLNRVKSFTLGKPIRAFIAREDQLTFDAQLSRLRGSSQNEKSQAAEAEMQLQLQPYKSQSVLVSLSVAARRDRKQNITGFSWILRLLPPLVAD